MPDSGPRSLRLRRLVLGHVVVTFTIGELAILGTVVFQGGLLYMKMQTLDKAVSCLLRGHRKLELQVVKLEAQA